MTSVVYGPMVRRLVGTTSYVMGQWGTAPRIRETIGRLGHMFW